MPLAWFEGPCANPDCDWDIKPGEIVVEVREGVYAHQGCEAGVSNG